jgi:hypothetical protein
MSIKRNRKHKFQLLTLKSFPVFLVGEVIGLGLFVSLTGSPVHAASYSPWTEQFNVSSQMNDAWFPDITVDSQGIAHLIFLGSDFKDLKDESLKNKYDMDFYQAFSPEGKPLLAEPLSITTSPFGWVARASITTNNKDGRLEMLFRSRNSLSYQAVPVTRATSALNWTEPRNIDDNGTTYYSDIAVDPAGVIHAVWTQVVGTDVTNLHQVIMYRSSADQGVTWSFPRQVVDPRYATTRVVLKVDNSGGLHLSWDDGYDNQTGRFTSTLGGYARSLDGGATWSQPFNVGSETNPVVQTVTTPFGDKGVMLVWRNLTDQTIEYSVSQDRGASWSKPTAIPGITARSFSSQHQFDRYYLAADNHGAVHLAAVGQTVKLEKGIPETEGQLGVFHLVWQAGKWSESELVSDGPGFVEYPRIGIGPDRLHFVWFSRDKPFNETSKNIWYSSRPYDTGVKTQPVVQYNPPTPTAGPDISAAPAPTASPILAPVEQTTSATWMNEAYAGTFLALLPVAGLTIIFSVGIVILRRRKR